MIAEEGQGAVVFMHLQGGGMDSLERVFLRDFEGDKQELAPPRAQALRDLGTGCQILLDLGMQNLRLITSSPRPIVGIEAYGLDVVERVGLPVAIHPKTD
jgi:3,4-dihydroxy 2-butanone 4-phosphate synthase/GTP cyclohydrolase II